MRLVLAGTSHWHAGMHLDAMRTCGADVVGVWDEKAEHAAQWAQAHGLRALPRFSDVLSAGADAVLLMGHPGTVSARACAIIEAGIPLILEKPAASSTAALAGIADLAREKAAFVSVPLPNRFGPTMLRFNELRASSRAGALAHAHFRLVNGPPERYAVDGVPWVADPAIGGGALRNLGIHGVDGALSLATGRLSLRSATVANRVHRDSPVEDYALLVLEDEAGAVFTVEAGYTFAWMRAGGDFEWRIVSANATLIDRGDHVVCVTLDDGAAVDLPAEPPATRYRLCMRDTLDRLAQGVQPAISVFDYVNAMALIDGAYEKAKQCSE
jgi:predicted dehydrogenase